MAQKRNDPPRKRREYKKKESGVKMNTKKCPHCGSNMKYKGPKDAAGTMYWKCRNKECGRTINFKKEPHKPIIPLAYNKSARTF